MQGTIIPSKSFVFVTAEDAPHLNGPAERGWFLPFIVKLIISACTELTLKIR